jgi:ATP-dependent helicase/DNAse subunit B
MESGYDSTKASMVDVRHPQMKGKRNHHLFLGPFQPELESSFFRLLKQKREPDPLAPSVVLVGSNLLGLYLRRALSQNGGHHANVRFLTFIDLARSLAEEKLQAERRLPLPRFGEWISLVQTDLTMEAESFFHPLAGRRGFQRALSATFRDLADGGIDRIPALGNEKFIEINRLYEHFRRQVQGEFCGDSEIFFVAAKESDRFQKIFGCEEVFVYGFYDFTYGQKKLLEALTENLDIFAFMPWRDSPGFLYAQETLSWFRKLGYAVQNPKIGKRPARKDLWPLQESLFQENPQEGEAQEGAQAPLIISAPGEDQEVREIAREIVRMAREEDIPFYEMAILLRNTNLYAPLIAEIFQALQIPIYLQRGSPLSRTQTGKGILLFLRLIESQFPRSQVMEFLTFAPMAWTRFFAEEPPTAQWDVISREAGVVKGKAQWEERLLRFSSQELDAPEDEGGQQADLRRIGENLRAFLGNLFAVLEQFPREGRVSEMIEATLRLLTTYFEATEDGEGIEGVIKNLESLDPLCPKIDFAHFRELLAEALEQSFRGQGAFQKGGVCVSDLMPARGLSFRVVFIPGLVERSFPAPSRQDPLLLDHEREVINRTLQGRGEIPLKRSRFQEEKILFSLAVGAAREKLILSFPRLDPQSGRERLASHFLLRLGETLEGEPLDYSRLEHLGNFRRIPLSRLVPDEPHQAIDELEFDLLQIQKALRTQDGGELGYLQDLFPFFARSGKLAQRRWGTRIFTEYDGCLLASGTQKLLQERFAPLAHSLSATKLETYALCPFRYFLKEILKLRTLEAPEEIWRVRPLDRGQIIHQILYQFHREVQKEISGPLQSERFEDYWKRMEKVAHQVFGEAQILGVTGFPLLWDLDQQTILGDLKGFLQEEMKEDSGLTPTHFEMSFGSSLDRGKDLPADSVPLALQERGPVVSFRGRIDRIDFSPTGDYLRIIDYKTGEIQGQENGFSGGTALQLPIYLLAARRIFGQGRVDIERSWAEYCSVKRKNNFKRLPFYGENWEEKEEELKKIVKIIVQGISEGSFFPFREEGKSCGYCDFSSLCENGVNTLFEQKMGDRRAAPYLEMKGIP